MTSRTEARSAPAPPRQRAARGASTGILTPDRRLRVFVSSCLHELADERAAVQAAIESLHLTPILFELGARPHPPANLYRAYLEQSEIFVAIYWQSGGWVAPGSEVSGIEDEFTLAQDLPRLIYVKEPAQDREPRLDALIHRIQSDAGACYRSFRSAKELARLVTDDVALLLTERFQRSASPTGKRRAAKARQAGNLPAPPTRLVDREAERDLLSTFLRDDGVRLTALTGPGGVGKSRLAVEAAAAAANRFQDGVWLVPLASIRQPDLLPAAILETVKVPTGGRAALDALKSHLRGRQHLLVLDNFEQMLTAAPILAELLEAAPRLKILVTSRAPLHLRAEHEVPISPLRVPVERAAAADLLACPSVELFLDRARAARPGFEPTPADLSAVGEIVRRFDGLPLAIELVASRCRLLRPAELAARLTASLDVGGALRDLPDRQRTLRDVIQWSFELLDERGRNLFQRLSVFRRGFTVDGAEAVCPAVRDLDLLDALEGLVDSSLLQQRVEEGESRYYMLEMVGEFADEKLIQSGEAAEVRNLHARFIAGLVARANEDLTGPEQRRGLRTLDREAANGEAAMEWLLESGDIEALAEMTMGYWAYWWFFGRMAEGARRAGIALAQGGFSPLAEARLRSAVGILAVWRADPATATAELDRALELFRQENDMESAGLIMVLLAMALWGTDPDQAKALIDECRPLFAGAGSPWGVAVCANVMGWLAPPIDAAGNRTSYAKESLELSEASGDDLNLGMALANLGAQDLELGELQPAREHLAGSIGLLAGLADRYAITSALEVVAAVAALSHEPGPGAQLLGAAQGMREWLQVPVQPGHAERHERLVAVVRSRLEAAEYERLWNLGRELDYEAAVALALSACEAPRMSEEDGDELG